MALSGNRTFNGQEKVVVTIRAPGGERIPAPWNFLESDVDDHYPQIQDQMIAIVMGLGAGVEWP